MRESYAQAVRGDGNRWLTMRGQVDGGDVIPPGLRMADVPPGPEREAMRARVIDVAALCLAGPVAQARYSKVALATLLQGFSTSGDTIAVHDLEYEWFAGQPDGLWTTALPIAQRVICNRQGWQAVQNVARQLIECGRLDGSAVALTLTR